MPCWVENPKRLGGDEARGESLTFHEIASDVTGWLPRDTREAGQRAWMAGASEAWEE